MADDWFRVPAVDKDRRTRPDYIDEIDGIEAASGNQLASSSSFIVRVYGTEVALSELANKPEVMRSTPEPLTNAAWVTGDTPTDSFRVETHDDG